MDTLGNEATIWYFLLKHLQMGEIAGWCGVCTHTCACACACVARDRAKPEYWVNEKGMPSGKSFTVQCGLSGLGRSSNH